MREDKELIDLFLARDEQAIEKCESLYRPYCWRIANNILNNNEDTEECLNSTWLQIWNSIPPTIPYSMRHYISTIVRNLAFNMYKSQHREKRGNGEMVLILDELERCIASSVDVEETYLKKEIITSINYFVMGLSQPERSMFVRRYYFADSAKKIALDYGMTENYVNVQMYRTRKKLQKSLRKAGLYDET